MQDRLVNGCLIVDHVLLREPPLDVFMNDKRGVRYMARTDITCVRNTLAQITGEGFHITRQGTSP